MIHSLLDLQHPCCQLKRLKDPNATEPVAEGNMQMKYSSDFIFFNLKFPTAAVYYFMYPQLFVVLI
jgi:hypothetical protein